MLEKLITASVQICSSCFQHFTLVSLSGVVGFGPTSEMLARVLPSALTSQIHFRAMLVAGYAVRVTPCTCTQSPFENSYREPLPIMVFPSELLRNWYCQLTPVTRGCQTHVRFHSLSALTVFLWLLFFRRSRTRTGRPTRCTSSPSPRVINRTWFRPWLGVPVFLPDTHTWKADTHWGQGGVPLTLPDAYAPGVPSTETKLLSPSPGLHKACEGHLSSSP